MTLTVYSEAPFDLWERSWRRGERASRWPYGMEHLAGQIPTARFIQQRPASGRVHQKLRDVVEHRAGYPAEMLVRDAPTVIRRRSSVLGVLEPFAYAAATWKRRHVPGWAGRPIAAVTCWSAELLQSSQPSIREREKRRIHGIDHFFVFSSNQTEIFDAHGIAPERVTVVRYGIDTEYYVPDGAAGRDIDILAVGQDRGRDYATLFAAAGDVDAEITVIAKPENLAGLVAPGNVRTPGRVAHAEYRSLLRRAKVVAVPTHEFAYPTGQSVALEAAAAGAAVMVTSTAAMRDYFQDGRTAIMPAVGSPEQWSDGLNRLLADDALRHRIADGARDFVLRECTTRAMWSAVGSRLETDGLI